MDFVEGEIFGIDKPYGKTSFQALARMRWLISQKLGGRRIKVGHAGTLDPLATGVLVLCTGKATKRIEELQAGKKEYEATVKLGATTPSYDMEHPEDATYPTSHITREKVEEALGKFVGDIRQVPPSFSACKVDGKRAYHLSRKGQEVELKAKTVRIDSIELLGFDPVAMEVNIRVSCGKGTYIRALARDLGRELGSGAYLTALRRTKVGDISIGQCVRMEDAEQFVMQA